MRGVSVPLTGPRARLRSKARPTERLLFQNSHQLVPGTNHKKRLSVQARVLAISKILRRSTTPTCELGKIQKELGIVRTVQVAHGGNIQTCGNNIQSSMNVAAMVGTAKWMEEHSRIRRSSVLEDVVRDEILWYWRARWRNIFRREADEFVVGPRRVHI